MRLLALVGFACSVVSARSNGEGDMVGDQTSATASLEIDKATSEIDCAETYDCELVSYDPVCGSDGVTYPNDCAFSSAFCAQENVGNRLFIQAAGECPDPADNDESQERDPMTPPSDVEDDEPLHTSLPTGSGTETSTDVDLMTVFCSLTCKLTPDQVCGTDGVTYINDCHLLSSKCEHPELEKESHGECAKSKQRIVLNALEVDADGLTEAPEKCNPMCDRIYDPICGSDGITYANACLLEYAECRNPNVKPFGAGKCPPHMQAARTAGTVTGLNNDGEICIPGPCPYTYAPVCGSDGQTHDNLCLFANARCEHPQHSLTVIHDGECDADTQLTCETMTCPTFTECREQLESDETVVAYCADICSPDRCSEREDCELVDSDCFTAPCSPIAMCIPKVQDG